MSFFNKLKEFQNQILQVENTIVTNKQDYLEVYERNLQLENEISERTNELNVTNRRMLTLQHILDMMNSSTPISSVFTSIVEMLHGELGYLHSAIFQIKEDENGKFIEIINQSKDAIYEKVVSVLGKPIDNFRLAFPEKDFLSESLYENAIKQTVDLRGFLKSLFTGASEEFISKMLVNAQTRSVIAIPLKTMNKSYGWLVLFSFRDEAEEAEIDFLKLYAQQIELAITIADLFQVIKNQAVTDPLTSLYNRRYFEESLEKEVVRAKRMGQPFTIIGLDLDFLKQINDKLGHSFGDLAITTVADALKKNARSIDVAARIGGEEFDVLLPGVDSTGGQIAAERIRAAIESYELDQIGHITASIGVATYPEHSENVDEILELVDQAMYTAKRNGRNRVVVATPIQEISWQEVATDTFMEILSKHKLSVPKEISELLHSKITQTKDNKDDSTPKEVLYSISDMLAKTYNPSHGKGVTKNKIQLATKIAKLFNISSEEIDKLKIAILLYDIGNLMIPQEVLQKASPLNDSELAEIKKHPVIAAREILKPISEIQDIIPIIEHHHENWDGTGYPGEVSGKDIPLASQIILILDAYFALTEPRSYREAMSAQEALGIIEKEANKKWNPELVKEFVNLVGKSLK